MTRTKTLFTLSVLSALSVVGFGCVAQAQPNDSRGPQGGPPSGHHKPPQEAFDACKSSTEGDACNVSIHGNSVTGTCEAHGEDGLACRPSGPPPPPPQAVDACSKSKEGDDCSVTFHDDEIDGTCVKMRDVLACMPEGMPSPPAQG